jgi:hypothetical protein
VVLIDEDFLSPLAAVDDFEFPESLLADPFFAESELPAELSDDDPLDPFAELSLAAGTLLAPFRLSVR